MNEDKQSRIREASTTIKEAFDQVATIRYMPEYLSDKDDTTARQILSLLDVCQTLLDSIEE